MSELSAKQWAVISERGREATDLTYQEARRLVHQLTGEGRHGLCIVTNNAANRLPVPSKPAPNPSSIPSKV